MSDYTKAPRRRRPKRIQRKIDKRFGLLRCDRQAIYIVRLSQATEAFSGIGLEMTATLSKLGSQMTDIVKDARRLRK